MRWPWKHGGRAPRLSAELRERESVRPLELFFDLVFEPPSAWRAVDGTDLRELPARLSC